MITPRNPLLKVIFLILVATCLILLSSLGFFLSLRGYLASGVEGIANPFVEVIAGVDDISYTILNLQNIALENNELKERVARLEQQVNEAEIIREQNSWLLSQLGLIGIVEGEQGQLARVSRYEYFPSPGYMYVETGGSDIAVGDYAVSYNFIVGQVTELIGRYAKLRLLIAPETEIPVRVGNEIGFLVGSGGVGIGLSGIGQQNSINIGDEVRLLESQYLSLEGFLLGKVVDKSGSDTDTEITVEIATPIDLQNLNYVIIISK